MTSIFHLSFHYRNICSEMRVSLIWLAIERKIQYTGPKTRGGGLLTQKYIFSTSKHLKNASKL